MLVAATGSLWGPGGERGVFKTTDGGKTWKQVLKVDDDTGANDLVMDPNEQQDPVRVDVPAPPHAVLHERRRPRQRHLEVDRRRRDVDAAQGAAFPTARSAASRSTSTASARTSSTRSIEGPASQGRGGAAARARRRRARRGGAAAAAQGGRGGGGALNNAPTGLYRSDDGGATWRKVNNANPRPMYFSQVRIDPNDPDVVYLGGVGLHQTHRRRQDDRAPTSAAVDPRRRPRDLDQSGQLAAT